MECVPEFYSNAHIEIQCDLCITTGRGGRRGRARVGRGERAVGLSWSGRGGRWPVAVSLRGSRGRFRVSF